jgi:hypothetical protein
MILAIRLPAGEHEVFAPSVRREPLSSLQMGLLAGTLSLHGLECPHGKAPCRCGPVLDTEALARSVLRAHLRGARASRNGNGGSAFLSAHDYDDLLERLIGDAWEASCRPRRGIWLERPFGAYCVWLMHRRVVDWYRERFPGSRYESALALEYGLEDEDGTHHDPEGPGVNVGLLSACGRETYFKVAVPMAEEGLSAREFADQKRADEHRLLRWVRGRRERVVERLLESLRAELVAQGIGPAVQEDMDEWSERRTA